jgi:hypothetical protein
MVEMKNYILYPSVYSFVTLSLILSLATTTVERAFSTMNMLKIVYITEWEFSGWMIVWLCTLKMIYSRLLTMKKSCSDFKI